MYGGDGHARRSTLIINNTSAANWGDEQQKKRRNRKSTGTNTPRPACNTMDRTTEKSASPPLNIDTDRPDHVTDCRRSVRRRPTSSPAPTVLLLLLPLSLLLLFFLPAIAAVADGHGSALAGQRDVREWESGSGSGRGRRERRQAAGGGQDLCTLAGCECTGHKAEFVRCNFTGLGSDTVNLKAPYFLQPSVKTLDFHLSPRKRLNLDESLFNNNRVQRLAIHGGTQVELLKGALAGNTKAPLQQIDFVSTGHVILGPYSFSRELCLNVTDAREVIVRADAFVGAIAKIYFLRVQNLLMFEGSFRQANASSHLTVEECTLNELNPLHASLREVTFRRTRIGRISANSFDVTELSEVKFEGCEIGEVQSKAFTEKLFSKSLSIVNSTIDTIRTDAIHRCIFVALHLVNNHIRLIEENAIQPQFTKITAIQNNTIETAKLQWLHLSDWTDVLIDHNRFGLYNRAAIATQPKNPNTCTFHHNVITAIQTEGSLYFGPGYCRVHNVTLAKPCVCGAHWPRALFRGGPRDGELAEVNCAADQAMRECYNTTHMVWTEFEAKLCPPTPHFLACEKRRLELTRMHIDGFAALDPAASGGGVWRLDLGRIALIASAGAVLVMLLIAMAMLCSRIKRARRLSGNGGGGDCDGNVTCSEQILTRCDANALAAREANAFRSAVPLMVMKPSKSFSVDDRVIIRQTLHDMKGRYEAPLYDQVYNNTMKVLNDSLEEPEKVAAIGEIIEALHECQKVGGDFVAFTDILYRQLVPHAEDPVYAELMDRDGADERQMAEVGLAAGQNEAAAAAAAMGGDHIYAEPQNLQLPLLTSDYAWPLDRDAPAYSEYAEPHRVPDTFTRQIISPYAIAATPSNTLPNSQQPALHQHSLRAPHSRPHMPDLLANGSRPSTSHHRAANTFHRAPPPPYTPTAAPRPVAPAATAISPASGAAAGTSANPAGLPVYAMPAAKSKSNVQRLIQLQQQQQQQQRSVLMSPAGRSPVATTSGGAGADQRRRQAAAAVAAAANDEEAQNHSDHSGGSDVTCRMDELVYAEATAPSLRT